MAQQLFEVGLGLSLDGLASVLPCNGAPGGDAGTLDAAPVGSLALDYTNGKQYQKTTAGTGTDKWQSSGADADTEAGYIRTFIGKSAAGNETPSYTSYTYTGGQTVSLETAISGIDSAVIGVQNKLDKARYSSTASVTNTTVTLDSVSVDSFDLVRWIVHAKIGTNVYSVEVVATHDGTLSNDATKIDYVTYGKLKIGTISGIAIDVDLNGATTAQVMRLRVTSTETNPVAIKSARYSL